MIINSIKNPSIFVKELQYCHYLQLYGSNLAICNDHGYVYHSKPNEETELVSGTK